ncbi:MAG: HoxN/HupN/NixA family nickel/cobalt transporter [Gemmatimonas sp.]
MRTFLSLFDDQAHGVRRKGVGIYALLVLANMLAWGWALVEFGDRPALLGTALLAYIFGLRHAVDADHIAAIDNVVRKLMHTGKRPIGVGFFFSLGHSTVVVLAVVAIAATAAALQTRFAEFKDVGGVIGTSVSAAFLLILALANLLILRGVWRSFQTVRRGGNLDADDLDLLMSKSGFFARIFRPLFRTVTRSWHMYPLGFLFGLGFDTASEIGLLGLSAVEAAQGLSIWSVLVFPALFTAGMALVDTMDSGLMVGAYGWAFVNPVRKLWYNLTITAVSVVVAVLIGGIEALGLISEKLQLEGAVWALIDELNEDLASFGFVVIGVFAVSWIASVLIYRWKRFDQLAPEKLVAAE